LGNGGGNLETLVEDNLLALESDVFGPLHEAGEVAGGLDVLAYSSSEYTIAKTKIYNTTHRCQSFWGWPRREGFS
jgi:hypothetical protein